jgi:hypothetical protein
VTDDFNARDLGRPLTPGEASEAELLTALLAEPSTWIEPPAGLEDAVVEAIDNATVVAPVAPLASAGARGHRRFRRGGAWLAVAAALVAVAVGIGLSTTHGSENPDFKGELAATGLAPGARGIADMYKNTAGFRVVLDAHGLPVLPSGEYYQGWLKNTKGALVPIGTFSSSDGRVILWSGVSAKEFPTLSVTIESADGNQASSGRRVLVGKLLPD